MVRPHRLRDRSRTPARLRSATTRLLAVLLVVGGHAIPRLATAATAVPPAERGTSAAERMGLHNSGNIRTMFWNFGMIGDYPPDPANVDLSVWHSVEAPLGTGMNYSDGATPFLLASIVQSDQSVAYIMETGYRERQGISPYSNRIMRLEPRPGFIQPDPAINPARSPAISDDPRTWPSVWPDKLADPVDPGWPGSWNGYFGKGAVGAQESYMVMDDDYYDAWPLIVPDPGDPTRRGLGLRIAVRSLQWPQPLGRDVIFWHYEITNEGTIAFDENLVFGLYEDAGVGSSRISCDGVYESDDDYAFYDGSPLLNLGYIWDGYGHGVNLSGPCGTTGYSGYAFLETPGDPLDGEDNDQDGITDERPDGGAGAVVSGSLAIEAYAAAHYDLDRFTERFGSVALRPACLAGAFWTGDEDMDWTAAADDLGADGTAGTLDPGEGDGQPTEGEPHYGARDPDETDQLGLTGFKLNRIKPGPGNPSWEVDGIVFYTGTQDWPRRLWEKFTAPDPADRFDPPQAGNYNIAYLIASGPLRLAPGQTIRFSLALAWAPDLPGLRQTVRTARTLHEQNYLPAVLDVPAAGEPARGRPVLLGAAPNPVGRATHVRLRLGEPARVCLEVFDVGGRRVAARDAGALAAGERGIPFDAAGLPAGLYPYRLRITDPASGDLRAVLSGRMVVTR